MNSNTWHAAYVRWYDHRKAGHCIRAAVWGWITDRIAERLKPVHFAYTVDTGPEPSDALVHGHRQDETCGKCLS
jgi:hypothetical protein